MKKERYHHFDFLRAIAVLLGIPLHACLAYGEIEYHWVIKDISHSYIIDIMLDFLRLFRMPLFFIISGFFSHLIINKGNFLQKRTKRLLYPMLVFFLLLIIPLKLVWLAMENPAKVFSFDYKFLSNYVVDNLFAGPTQDKFRHDPNWGHLWFLMYLYLFSLLSVPLSKVKVFKFNNIKTLTIFSMFLTYLSYFLMKSHWVDAPFYMYPTISISAYYGIFYFFGWMLFKFKDFTLSKSKSIWLIVIGCTCAIARSYIEVDSHLDIFNLKADAWTFTPLAVISTWSLVLGQIFLFKHLFKKANKKVTYFVEGSYFIYLIHLPIIIVLQIMMAPVNLSWVIKFPLVTLLAITFSVLIYKFAVRGKFTEKFLNGAL